VVTAAGDRGVLRRVRRRARPDDPTPASVGAALREARQGAQLSVESVADRTGVPRTQLEALEDGDLSRFPDRRAAVTAVRRYCDLVDLDADGLSTVVDDHLALAAAGIATGGPGAPGGPANGGRATGGAGGAGQLRRPLGEATHLRAFTQTAEVPGVRRDDPVVRSADHRTGRYDITGSFPVVDDWIKPERSAPFVLRAAVWLVVVLLVVAGVGLAVHHYEPQWLTDIHLQRVTPLTVPGSHGATTGSGTGATTPTLAPGPGKAPQGPVTEALTTAGSATVTVQAASYSVVVSASAPCWTVVNTPQSFKPVFNAELAAGQVDSFDSADGQLTVNVGASGVSLQVRIAGRLVSNWVFRPPTAPFVLNFNASPA